VKTRGGSSCFDGFRAAVVRARVGRQRYGGFQFTKQAYGVQSFCLTASANKLLSDLGAVYIHGGVDAGDEDDDETREGKIRLFHDDPNVRILVANPAAASEGVSLHRICHHAIYLDRTFNAAHYLQSEDRIHRFGLAKDQKTTIEIVECADSVDETVRDRLGYKIGMMAEALEDSSLKPDPIALDPTDIDDFDDYSTGLAEEDIQALLKDFSREER